MELSSLVDSITTENTEYATVPYSSNLETIFSPVLEPVDVYNELNILNSTGSFNKPNLAQLIANDSDDNSRSSLNYQTCNVIDFYIFDVIVADLPIDRNSISKPSNSSTTDQNVKEIVRSWHWHWMNTLGDKFESCPDFWAVQSRRSEKEFHF